ncbi:hypothetical protein LY78DRAFT_441529 [Colletotrichum sublineola]|nr:hypothetical protein LY78DRAFT_441529 [Colletotrichum sublineola]
MERPLCRSAGRIPTGHESSVTAWPGERFLQRSTAHAAPAIVEMESRREGPGKVTVSPRQQQVGAPFSSTCPTLMILSLLLLLLLSKTPLLFLPPQQNQERGTALCRRSSGCGPSTLQRIILPYLEFFTPPSNGVFSGAEDQVSLVGGRVVPMWPCGRSGSGFGFHKQAHAMSAQASSGVGGHAAERARPERRPCEGTDTDWWYW